MLRNPRRLLARGPATSHDVPVTSRQNRERSPDIRLLDLGEALSAMPEVDYVVTTAGSFDVLAEVVCEDDDHLLELLTQRIRPLPGVTSTETFVYLKLNKQHYNWGTR